jgi:hypothetical protein
MTRQIYEGLIKNYFRALGELLMASLASSFVMGLFIVPLMFITSIHFGEVYFLLPFMVMFGAVVVMLWGMIFALPIIFAGAAIILFMSSKGYRNSRHLIAAGLVSGGLYGLIVSLILNSFFFIFLFTIGGTLAGYFVFSARIKNIEEEKPL